MRKTVARKAAAEETLLEGRQIWGQTRTGVRGKLRMELTDLVRFRGCWYCGFREGFIHMNHPSGRGRIIRSVDGRRWESVFLKEWDGADVREVKLSVTSEGLLMANTCLYFVSREARADGMLHTPSRFDRPPPGGRPYGRYYQLVTPGTPEDDAERSVARQSVTWLSEDGRRWGGAYACPSGVNTWRWEVCWHQGMGYSVSYCGKDPRGALYRTRDGRSWRLLHEGLFPEGGNEGALGFEEDGTLYCLLRDARPRNDAAACAAVSGLPSDGHRIETVTSGARLGSRVPMFGIARAPGYRDWKWRDLTIDWRGDGDFRSVDEVLRAPLGGPKLLRLRDGRWLALGRVLGPERDDGHITLFLLDPATARLTRLAECRGATYGGMAEHAGRIWISYAGEAEPDCLGVFLASVRIPRVS